MSLQFKGELLKICRHQMASTVFVGHGSAVQLRAGNKRGQRKKAAYNKRDEPESHLSLRAMLRILIKCHCIISMIFRQ